MGRMVKDRLPQLHRILQENHEITEVSSFIDDSTYTCDSSLGSPNSLNESTEKFLIKADIVQARLRSCQLLIDEMEIQQTNIIVKTDNDDRLDEELECLIKRIKDLTTTISNEINALEENLRVGDKSWSIEQRIKECQVSSLQRVFHHVIHKYNTSQIEHREKCKMRIKRQLEICGKVKTDNELEDLLENKDFSVFTTNLLVDTQQMQNIVKMVESRHADIVRLEKSIYELQGLFIEIAKTIEKQGLLIDNIQHNVEIADECLRVAVPSLRAAKQYKRRRLLFCCPCFKICQLCTVM